MKGAKQKKETKDKEGDKMRKKGMPHPDFYEARLLTEHTTFFYPALQMRSLRNKISIIKHELAL